ncbi:MAG: hypothetical protein PVG71_08060, partial [Anaerolineae bacterium]
MHRSAGHDEQPLAGLERAAADEALETRPHGVGNSAVGDQAFAARSVLNPYPTHLFASLPA